MDEEHLANAVRYVSLNPVKARLVDAAKDWDWSSVKAHLKAKDDGLVRVAPVLERYGSFRKFMGTEEGDEAAFRALRQSETTGRRQRNDRWLKELERQTGRTLTAQKRGPKASQNSEN
jgi:REP-associated tyrosine transposase